MNKKNLIVMAIALAMVITTAIVVGAGYDPGSAEDPIVTKSYVDSKIAEALEGISGSGGQGGSEGGLAFTPIKVDKSKQLIGGEGTELILRSGKAKAVAAGKDGLSDVTIGQDITAGKDISQNHLLLVPRDDGRGIEAVTDIWVMVKGPYTVN